LRQLSRQAPPPTPTGSELPHGRRSHGFARSQSLARDLGRSASSSPLPFAPSETESRPIRPQGTWSLRDPEGNGTRQLNGRAFTYDLPEYSMQWTRGPVGQGPTFCLLWRGLLTPSKAVARLKLSASASGVAYVGWYSSAGQQNEPLPSSWLQRSEV
jgi:hypothetical protein